MLMAAKQACYIFTHPATLDKSYAYYTRGEMNMLMAAKQACYIFTHPATLDKIYTYKYEER